jgi:GGDEF domain-containing protein
MLEGGLFLERLAGEMDRCRRARLTLALALFEINGLARMDKGRAERVLRALSSRLWETAQDQDVPGRIRPEMLALALPGSGRFQALALAECVVQDVCRGLAALRIGSHGLRAGVAAPDGMAADARQAASDLLDMASLALERASCAAGARVPERVCLFRKETDPAERKTLVLASEKQFLFFGGG